MEDIVKALNELNRKDIWDILPIISSLISALFLILTYCLARNINKKIDKPIREKQLNTVYELIEVLQTTIFQFSRINCKILQGYPLEINFFQIKTNKFDKSLLHNEIVINKNFYTTLEFIKHKNNSFLAPQIACLLDKIDFELIDNHGSIDDGKDYTLIGDSVEILLSRNIGQNIIYKTHGLISFNEYKNNLISIHEEIYKWINKPKVKLNLK